VNLELISLDEPVEARRFAKGRFELYRVGPATIGRTTCEPGWRWAEHVGPTAGTAMCQVEHVGLALSGQAAVRIDSGAVSTEPPGSGGAGSAGAVSGKRTERVMSAGELFYVPPGHDSWVVGDEPYVSLHILGGEDYAAPSV
jgi:hypothetical protein